MITKEVKNLVPNNRAISIVSPPKSQVEIEQEQPLRNEEIDWGDDSFEIEEFEKKVELKKILVEKVLKRWEKTTNSDRLLDFECLRAEFPEIEITTDKKTIYIRIPKKLMKFLPSPESYRRQRQSLNQQGKCCPTDEKVRIRRQRQNRVIKRFYGKKKGQSTGLNR